MCSHANEIDGIHDIAVLYQLSDYYNIFFIFSFRLCLPSSNSHLKLIYFFIKTLYYNVYYILLEVEPPSLMCFMVGAVAC